MGFEPWPPYAPEPDPPCYDKLYLLNWIDSQIEAAYQEMSEEEM